MLMTSFSLQRLVTLELMNLSGVSRAITVCDYDVTMGEHVFRWFGGGKTVGLRIPMEVESHDAWSYVRAALEEWNAASAGTDDDAEYERLKRGAEACGLSWMQETLIPDEEQKPLDNG